MYNQDNLNSGDKMIPLKKIISFLDRELNLTAFNDDSQNGLQVENSGRICRVCSGVDASMEFFEKAAERKADLLICHHGISWGDSLKRITGLNYSRLKFLMDHDMALYACHLPLDAHPRLGNNALICEKIGLKSIKPFGVHHGIALGFCGNLPKAFSYDKFKEQVRSIFGKIVGTMDFGKKKVRTVAVVSGGGAGEIAEAGESGIDVFVSGEPRLMAYHLAQEYRINAIFAGHYATEVFGVQAVGSLLAEKFGLEAEFINTAIRF